MRLEIAKRAETKNALARDKTPGPLTEAEWKMTEAEVAAATAEGAFKQAELRLLELRMSEAKQ